MNNIKFTINRNIYSLTDNVPLSTTLLDYLRTFAHLSGTKGLCYEGGCGVCTVIATIFDHEKQTTKTISLRACQTLVYSCDGWIITTIEHLGNSKAGYNRIQVALKNFNGTQCGYCSPGFIMTMHGLLMNSPTLNMEEIEKAFDGNICRCTGYRPILDAFKSFAKDAPAVLKDKLTDIEDSYPNCCSGNDDKCQLNCPMRSCCPSKSGEKIEAQSFVKNVEGVKWFRPKNSEEIMKILRTNNEKNTRFVVGNTGHGVFKDDGPFDVLIDTSGVKELYETNSSELSIGANVSLSRCIVLFHETAQLHRGFHHLEQVAKHWEVVGNAGIRNVSCWAGNLMMKFHHPGFCSDVFTTLLAVEVKIKVVTTSETIEVGLEELMLLDMSKSLIVSMSIPPQPENVIIRTFKITPRAVNAHAYVNAAFKFQLDFNDGFRIVSKPNLVLAGINAKMVRASETEKWLVGKQLNNGDNVHKAIEILGTEIHPDSHPQDASPEYRRKLSQSLLYKAILGIIGETADGKVVSGGYILERPISSGKQIHDVTSEFWPIGQAIPKLEADVQISGEAEYLDDVSPLPNELYGAFVQTTIAKGTIKTVSSHECLKYPGVVDFITAEDIIGKNSFSLYTSIDVDQVFAEVEVKFAGQAIGLVVAQSRKVAQEAAKLVKITYENVTKPILTIKESIKQERIETEGDPFKFGDIDGGFSKSAHILEGEFSQGGQFHFPTEPLAARVVPIEDGFDVYSTTQWITKAQKVISNVLQIPANNINMQVRRIGGAFGGKSTRSNLVAAAAAIAAQKLRRPVRVTLTLTDHMTLVGWREPYYSKYKVGFNDDGKLQAVKVGIYSDPGNTSNEGSSPDAAQSIPNTYHCPHWFIQPYYALTDTAANTWCRGPGITEGIATMETIIDHIADHLNLDPVAVRETNLLTYENPEVLSSTNGTIIDDKIFPSLKKSSQIDNKKIQIKQFNLKNRWRKRGIAMIPILYPISYSAYGFTYNVHVAIYEHDGTVAIKHGGIEMGQGINTKIAQVAAKILNIPLKLIQVKPTDDFSGSNSSGSSGSMASDLNAYGVQICCERIKKRMDVVAKEISEKGKDVSWVQLVKKCFQNSVDISERYRTVKTEQPKDYKVWAGAVAEVEIDVLTGQFIISQTDIVEDCGRSLSPLVDIGQIEGAFIMGVGLVTTEKVKYDPQTGQTLSNGTWEYKVPMALDIPVDFRVTLMQKGDNPYGVLRSKATGEPALCLSFVVVAALRDAIKSARIDNGVDGWFQMDTPVTVEDVHRLCNVQPDQFDI